MLVSSPSMPTSRHSLTQFSSLVSFPKYRSNSLTIFLIFFPDGRGGGGEPRMTPPKARFAMLSSREVVEPPFARGCVEAFLGFFFAMMKITSGRYTDFSCMMSCEKPGRNKERRKESNGNSEGDSGNEYLKTLTNVEEGNHACFQNPCLSITRQSSLPFSLSRCKQIGKPSPLDHAGTHSPPGWLTRRKNPYHKLCRPQTCVNPK